VANGRGGWEKKDGPNSRYTPRPSGGLASLLVSAHQRNYSIHNNLNYRMFMMMDDENQLSSRDNIPPRSSWRSENASRDRISLSHLGHGTRG
jgi:hypothetical protein